MKRAATTSFGALFLVAALIFSLPLAAAIDQPLWYYSFENDTGLIATDNGPGGYDADITGSGVLQSSVVKVGNQAAQYDGGEYMDLSWDGTGIIDGTLEVTTPQTVSLWMYPTTGDSVLLRTACDATPTQCGYQVSYDNANKYLLILISEDNGDLREYSTPVNSISANSWNHLVIELNGTSNLGTYTYAYINNTPQILTLEQSVGPVADPTGGNNSRVGNSALGATVYVDEVGQWNKILTGAEREELWNNGTGASPYVNITPPTPPVVLGPLEDAEVYYSFENCPALTVLDDSGYGQNGQFYDWTCTSLGKTGLYAGVATSTGLATSPNYPNVTATLNTANYSDGSGVLNTPLTISYWVKETNSEDYKFHFSMGLMVQTLIRNTAGLDDYVYDIYLRDAGDGYRRCNPQQQGAFQNAYLPNGSEGEYKHISFTVPTGGACPSWMLVNGVNLTVTNTALVGTIVDGWQFVTPGTATLGLMTDLSGYFAPVDNDAINIDDFGIWARGLTVDEHQELYQNGLGFNPYSDEPPQLLSLLPPIILNQSSNEIVDYQTYWVDASNITINWEYLGVNYSETLGGTATESPALQPDFAVFSLDTYRVQYFSFVSNITPVTLDVVACNNNGCQTANQLLAIGEIVEPEPEPVAGFGEGTLGYINGVLSEFFPDKDELNSSGKTLMVVFALALLLGGLMLIRYEGASSAFLTYGGAIGAFFIIMFFTSIGYIPIWIIVVLVLLLVGVAIARSRMMLGV